MNHRIIQLHAAICGASTALSIKAIKTGANPKDVLINHLVVIGVATLATRQLTKP